MDKQTAEKDLSEMSSDELNAYIEDARKKIGKYRKQIENPSISTGGKVLAMTDAITSMVEEIKEAQDMITEKGGGYEITDEEKKDREFNEKVPDISQMILSIRGAGYGSMDKYFRIRDGKVFCKTVRSQEDEQEAGDNDTAEHEMALSADDFIKGMKDLHIGTWKNKYQLSDYGYAILDGTGWALQIGFGGKYKSVQITGDMIYPYSFDAMLRLLDITPDW